MIIDVSKIELISVHTLEEGDTLVIELNPDSPKMSAKEHDEMLTELRKVIPQNIKVLITDNVVGITVLRTDV
jgi:hypothetical protein